MRLQHILRCFAAALAFALLASPLLHAQGGGEEFDFDDIPVDDARQYYVAVGGGYLGMLNFMNFDELNKLNARLGLPNFEGQMYMNGGGGLISLLVIPNLRLGVFGAGGSRIIEADVTGDAGAKFRRSVRFSHVVTAAQVDYAIRVFRSFTILPGFMVGSGNYTLEMTQTANSDDAPGADFTTVFTPGAQGGNSYARISSGHLFYYPAVNFEYAVTQFVMVRAGVGYSGSAFEGKWTDGAGIPINNVPTLNANGLTAQFGVFFGLFQNQ